MPCPRCGAATNPGQKFCAECGLPLGRACPHCGAEYEGSPKFCAECGTALAATQGNDLAPASAATVATAAPQAERRYVSVLFADLVGFTALSEAQDPEEVRELLSRYFEVSRQVIEGYGGSIEKFIGDAVMAVWGAPVAREDDPERAVRAALELVDGVKQLSVADQRLSLRAGVLSGEAAVTAGRTGEGMVAGDLVNTASRLQSVAAADVVLVGESTYRATSAAIAYEPAGEQVLKGKQAPVDAWRALRVVARVGGEGRDEGLEPPFVGRDYELRLLKDQLHAAEREGRRRMVAITGQAGIGKSRLVWELEKYLDGLAGPKLYYWHQGRSPSYGEGVSYWALGEMVRRRARIAEAEDGETTREKLAAMLAEFVPDEHERRRLEPALGALLGVDEANWQAREELFSAWRTLFERIADRGPTVLVFEDIQWADTGLIDFIEHMLDWTNDRPILILTLARPEFLERRPNFGLGHRAYLAVQLDPLPDDAMTEMLRGLVPGLPQADLQRIVERSEGVPLYAVETIRSLVDGGHLVRRDDAYQLTAELPTLDVPPTLRALVASRLDALQPSDRALLQQAAVLGIVFAVAALAALAERGEAEVDARLRELARKELLELETDPRSPERGQFRFKQGLIREVAYATLSRRERQARHLAAARYFETLGDEELAGVLAGHYLEAFGASPDGDQGATVAAQARVALRAAAERASRLHSPAQALSFYEQAMAVTFDDADSNDLRVRAATAAVASGNFAKGEAYQREALAWARAHGTPETVSRLTARLGGWLLELSRIDEAMEMLSEALEELPKGEVDLSIELTGQLARGHMFRDEAEQGLAAANRALETAERLGGMGRTLQLIITKSWALSALGRFREALSLLIGARQMADDENDLTARTRSRFNLSSFSAIDDPHRGLRTALEGVAIDQQYGLYFASMAGNAAENAFAIGDFDEVMRLEATTPDSQQVMAQAILGTAAAVLAFRGDAAAARDRLAIFETSASTSSSLQDRAVLSYLQSAVAFGAGDLINARRLALESRDAYGGSSPQISAIFAAHTAVLMRDIAGVRADCAWLSERRVSARWLERSRRTIDAGRLALEGSAEESLQLYRQVIDEWRAEELPRDLAFSLLERALLLGQVDARAAAGREEAAQIFDTMGAAGLVEQIEASAAAAAPAAGHAEPSHREAGTVRRPAGSAR